MKIPVELIENIIQGSIKEKWEYFKALDKIDEGDMELVKYGLKIKFDIRYLFTETSKIVIKDKQGKVLIGNIPYIRESYWDELDERENIMMDNIYNNIDDKLLLEGRK